MSASGVRMTTRQIYGSGPARGEPERAPRAPQRPLRTPPPLRGAAAAIVILLMLAGLRLAQTDSETMDRKRTAWFRVGERVTFLTREQPPRHPPALPPTNTSTRRQAELLFSSRQKPPRD